MTLWCPVALRILLFSLINDHDAVNIILTIASKDIEDESRKYHEENVDEYKKKGNQEWLTSLKEVHYDCVSSLDFNLSKCKYREEISKRCRSHGYPRLASPLNYITWPDYRSLGYTRDRYIYGNQEDGLLYRLRDIFEIRINLIIEHGFQPRNALDGLTETNTTSIERYERKAFVRDISKKKVSGAGGKMIHMKRNGYTWGTKTKLRDEKRREKNTNQQKRVNRSKKNDITFMKRNQMKKCHIR